MARVEKVGASLIPEALKMRREMLGIIYGRDEEIFKGELSDMTEEFFRNGDQTAVLAFEGEVPVGGAA